MAGHLSQNIGLVTEIWVDAEDGRASESKHWVS